MKKLALFLFPAMLALVAFSCGDGRSPVVGLFTVNTAYAWTSWDSIESFPTEQTTTPGEAPKSDEWQDEGPEDDGDVMFIGILKIESVSASQTASGSSPVVNARVRCMNCDESGNTIKEVKLVYRINGGEQRVTDMAYNTATGNWAGSLPEMPRGAVADYYVWAALSNGDVITGAFPYPAELVPAVPGANYSSEIVPDSADILNAGFGYDSEYLYAAFKTEAPISGGTLDPPYIMLYGIKITNPDTDHGEGLMTGKLWVYAPMVIKESDGTENPLIGQFLDQLIAFSIADDCKSHITTSGMIVLDIQKLMAGSTTEGIICSAEPSATITGNVFSGKIKRSAFGTNPSNQLRIKILTAANASIDSFMPLPLDANSFVTLNMSHYTYTGI
jgi:hypothetical protein